MMEYGFINDVKASVAWVERLRETRYERVSENGKGELTTK